MKLDIIKNNSIKECTTNRNQVGQSDKIFSSERKRLELFNIHCNREVISRLHCIRIREIGTISSRIFSYLNTKITILIMTT